jgi:hypothetical protein
VLQVRGLTLEEAPPHKMTSGLPDHTSVEFADMDPPDQTVALARAFLERAELHGATKSNVYRKLGRWYDSEQLELWAYDWAALTDPRGVDRLNRSMRGLIYRIQRDVGAKWEKWTPNIDKAMLELLKKRVASNNQAYGTHMRAKSAPAMSLVPAACLC